MKLAVLFHRFGPYHHARLAALARAADIVGVEYSAVDNTYAWAAVGSDGSYPVRQLFTDVDIDDMPCSLIVRRVGDAVGSIGADIVAIPGWSSPASLAALEWCCAAGTPAVLMSDSAAHDEPRSLWKEWLKARVVRLFGAALVGGRAHVEYAVQLGMPAGRVFVGYDTVDNDYFASQADAARTGAATVRERYALPERYFLASNRFVEKKNLPRVVDAYAAYLRVAGGAAWDLVALGDGPLMSAVKAQVARLGVTTRVHLPGFKQYEDLPAYYGLAGAFIHSSTSEQWGLVVNEAMAAGLAVLVSNRCGCAPDLVKEGVNGFSFDPYDVGGLAKLMLRMSSGELDLGGMGRESRDIIARNSPTFFAENMLHAARVALAAPRRRAGWLDRLLLAVLMRR